MTMEFGTMVVPGKKNHCHTFDDINTVLDFLTSVNLSWWWLSLGAVAWRMPEGGIIPWAPNASNVRCAERSKSLWWCRRDFRHSSRVTLESVLLSSFATYEHTNCTGREGLEEWCNMTHCGSGLCQKRGSHSVKKGAVLYLSEHQLGICGAHHKKNSLNRTLYSVERGPIYAR